MNNVTKILLAVLLVFLAEIQLLAQTATVTNTNDSGVGSLRSAIIFANNNPGTAINFNIPTTDSNYNSETGVFSIVVSSALPSLNRADIVIDGSTQTTFTGNTNTSILGTGGFVGVDNIALPQLDGPEIAIVDGNNIWMGFGISAPNCTVKNIAITGFDFGFRIYNAPNAIVENVVVGSTATEFALPSEALRTRNHVFYVESSPNGLLKNSLVGFGEGIGLFFNKGNAGFVVDGCEFTGNGRESGTHDGVDIASSSLNVTVKNSLSHSNRGNGIDMFRGNGNNTILNCTIINNGKSGVETSGVRVFGNNNLIEKNIISNNYGAGVLVVSDVHRAKVTKNSIFGNGGVTGENNLAPSSQIGIDLLSSADRMDKGQSPFRTINDRNDNDQGANMLQNFPVLESARITNGLLVLEGWTTPNTDVEFYIGQNNGINTHTQGKTYLFTRQEGSPDDLAPSAPTEYGPGPVSGSIVGEDRTKRFKFEVTLPSNVSGGTLLTALADKQGNVSEFSNGIIVTNAGALSPVLECVIPRGNNLFTAVFGYNNATGTTQNISVGNNNRFNPAPQNRGQVSTFETGRQQNVFYVDFNGSNLVWTLNNRTATASANSQRCSCDLGVIKTVNNQDPSIDEEITFTISVTNNSNTFSSVDAEVTDILDSNSFQYLSHNTNVGSYNVESGIWQIGIIEPQQTVSLNISAQFLADGENTAQITANNLADRNPLNNSSTVSISTANSSGGNNGGVESNGNMANKMALRSYQKWSNNKVVLYENYQHLPNFDTRNYQDARNELSSLVNYIPEVGPQSAQAFLTSPEELTQITNANEIISVDYFTEDNRRLAAVYATNSETGEVYEHTKIICDRLNGATLESIDYELIDEKVFIISKLVQPNGEVDYAIGFSAFKKLDETFEIDTKWNNEFFLVNPTDSVFNFQVWSVNRVYTSNLVANILEKIENSAEVIYLNQGAVTIPSVYAKSANYESGNIKLDIVNNTDAEKLFLFGSTAQVENGNRTALEIEQNLTSGNFELEIPQNIFDAGFSISNELYGGMDVLYVADGPWGIEFTEDNFALEFFEISPYTGSNQFNYNVKRNPTLSGELRGGASIFRMLKVNSLPVDLTAYNAVSFTLESEGTQSFEIGLLKKNIANWADQFRYTFTAEPGTNTFTIPFEDFQSANTSFNFDASDIFSITLVAYGNNMIFQPITMGISDMHFLNTTTVGLTEEKLADNNLSIYPNPIKGNGYLKIENNISEQVNITVYDLMGKKVANLGNNNISKGVNLINLNFNNYKTGVYLLRVEGSKGTSTVKFIVE